MKKLLILFMILPMYSMGQIYTSVYDTIPIGKMDTVKTIALITDGYLSARKTDIFIVQMRMKYYNSPGTFCFECENYWQFIKYLDADKKPLPNSITVWITK